MNIQKILAKATAATEFMYDKKATIMREIDTIKPNGADGKEWVPVHVDVPCRASSVTLNNTSQDAANTIRYDVKLFLSSSVEVRAGDIVEVHTLNAEGQKTGSTLYESAKEPFRYVSHQEVLLHFKEYA